MKTTTEIKNSVSHDEIARRAYELWEQDGRPENEEYRHWLEAERQLRGSPVNVGNPAYPTLEERKKIVEKNTGKHETVRKIPADDLKKHGSL